MEEHGIAYNIAFIMIKNKAVNDAYSMLLGQLLVIAAKVTQGWNCQQVIINGNKTDQTIPINPQACL